MFSSASSSSLYPQRSSLPNICTKRSNAPRNKVIHRRKIDYVKQNVGAFSPKRRTALKHNSPLLPTNVLWQIQVPKRRSLKNEYSGLSDQQQQCVDTHMKLIEKSRQKVVEAKQARFKGFFSPRILRSKARKLSVNRPGQTHKNWSSPIETLKYFVKVNRDDNCTTKRKFNRQETGSDLISGLLSPKSIIMMR